MSQQLEKIKLFSSDEKFIRSLLQNIQIPINTEQQSNIHLLLLSDTSNLDFDTVIIIEANDNVLPSKIGESSLIPYNLRRGYGLPTTDTTQYRLEKFYFYKLINTSEDVHISYNATLGDKSRFLYQLEFESNIKIVSHSTEPTLHTHDKKKFLETSTVEVEPEEIKKIKVLTPSMINMYLDCPYKFFLSMMIKSEKDDYNLGLLVHKVLQQIYKKGTLVTEDFLNSVDVKKIIDDVFDKHIMRSGDVLIDKDVAELMVDKVIDIDKAYTPFHVFDVEYKAPAWTLVVDGTIFKIEGVIDRIDIKDNIMRIVDYKTGITKNKAKDLDLLFEDDKQTRPKAVLQVLLYATMMQQHFKNFFITPYIYDLRTNITDPWIYVGNKKIDNVDEEMVNLLEARVKKFIADMIMKNKISINKNSSCQFCKFADFCQTK